MKCNAGRQFVCNPTSFVPELFTWDSGMSVGADVDP